MRTRSGQTSYGNDTSQNPAEPPAPVASNPPAPPADPAALQGRATMNLTTAPRRRNVAWPRASLSGMPVEIKQTIAAELHGEDLLALAVTEKANHAAVTPLLHAGHLMRRVNRATTAAEWLALLNPATPGHVAQGVETGHPNSVFGLRDLEMRADVMGVLLRRVPLNYLVAAPHSALPAVQVQQAFMTAVQSLSRLRQVDLLRDCVGLLNGFRLGISFDNMLADTAHLGTRNQQQVMSAFGPVLARHLRCITSTAEQDALLDRLKAVVTAGPPGPRDFERTYDHLTEVVDPSVYARLSPEARVKLASLMDDMVGRQASLRPDARGAIATNLAYSLDTNSPAELNDRLLDHLDLLSQHDMGQYGDIALSNLIASLTNRNVDPVRAADRVVTLIERIASRRGMQGISADENPVSLRALRELQANEAHIPYLGEDRLGRLPAIERMLLGSQVAEAV
jgi:hypothetical protein